MSKKAMSVVGVVLLSIAISGNVYAKENKIKRLNRATKSFVEQLALARYTVNNYLTVAHNINTGKMKVPKFVKERNETYWTPSLMKARKSFLKIGADLLEIRLKIKKEKITEKDNDQFIQMIKNFNKTSQKMFPVLREMAGFIEDFKKQNKGKREI